MTLSAGVTDKRRFHNTDSILLAGCETTAPENLNTFVLAVRNGEPSPLLHAINLRPCPTTTSDGFAAWSHVTLAIKYHSSRDEATSTSATAVVLSIFSMHQSRRWDTTRITSHEKMGHAPVNQLSRETKRRPDLSNAPPTLVLSFNGEGLWDVRNHC
jgi:hypothetical protein